MTDTNALFVAAGAALVLLLVIWRLSKALLTAVFVALAAGVALYYVLPRLRDQDGPVGEAARWTQGVVDEAKTSLEKAAAGAKQKVRETVGAAP